MKFLFSKDMDSTSIENRFNWNISRASSANIAKTYNFGDEIPPTEVALGTYPDYVLYDKETQTASLGSPSGRMKPPMAPSIPPTSFSNLMGRICLAFQWILTLMNIAVSPDPLKT